MRRVKIAKRTARLLEVHLDDRAVESVVLPIKLEGVDVRGDGREGTKEIVICGQMVHQGPVLEVGELFVLKHTSGREGKKGLRRQLRLVGKLVEQPRLPSRRARGDGGDGGAAGEAGVGLEFGGRDSGYHLAGVRMTTLVAEDAHEVHVAVDLLDRGLQTPGLGGFQNNLRGDVCQSQIKNRRNEFIVELRGPHEPRLLVVLVHRVHLALLVTGHRVVHHEAELVSEEEDDGFPLCERSRLISI